MVKYLRISPNVKKPSLIYHFVTDPICISLWGKFRVSFISVLKCPISYVTFSKYYSSRRISRQIQRFRSNLSKNSLPFRFSGRNVGQLVSKVDEAHPGPQLKWNKFSGPPAICSRRGGAPLDHGDTSPIINGTGLPLHRASVKRGSGSFSSF